MWESNLSSRHIADKLSISDHHTVLGWAEDGDWVKGKNLAKLAQIEEENVFKAAAACGLDYAKVIDKTLELMDAQKPLFDDAEDKAESKSEGDESGGVLIQQFPDYKIQAIGNAQAIEILGMKKQKDLNVRILEPWVIQDSEGKDLLALGSKLANQAA